MKKAAILLVAIATIVPSVGKSLEWLDDLPTALNKARQEHKFVMLDFTGSDWCGWCMKLKVDVFDKPEFAEFAKANLICVEVDFPRHKKLDPNRQAANDRLAQNFRIEGYPTIIIV